MYEIIIDENSDMIMIRRENEDGSNSFFPIDESNEDYLAFIEANPDALEASK